MELIWKVDLLYQNMNSENRGIQVNHLESIMTAKLKESFTK